MKPRVEFLWDKIKNQTLVLVWKGMRVVYKTYIDGDYVKDNDSAARDKYIKKLKRKYK